MPARSSTFKGTPIRAHPFGSGGAEHWIDPNAVSSTKYAALHIN